MPNPIHVLVVDDDPDIRETVRLVLEDDGYAVTEAPDGLDALHHIRACPDCLVVVSNYNMPRLDGPSLLNFIIEDEDLCQKHAFLFITAKDRVFAPDFAQHLRDYHIPVLRKPFDIEELLATVQEVANRLPIAN